MKRRSRTALAQWGFASIALLGTGFQAGLSESGSASPRVVVNWDEGWLFSKGDSASAMSPEFDDSGWRQVDVPHDWSTEEPLSPEYASGNGYAAGGIGWYRNHVNLDAAWQGKSVHVEFDGVYANSQVWINGHFAGGRPNGYSSFRIDLSPYVTFGADANVLAVRVDHSRFADSRWYTGSGIYRPVRLVVTDAVRIAPWGVFVSTDSVEADSATLRIETTVQSRSSGPVAFRLHTDVLDMKGDVVSTGTADLSVAGNERRTVVQSIAIAHPRLWSPDSPALYALRSRLETDAGLTDETTTPFGIRTFAFDPNTGFILNDRSMKLQGVCLHHDAGALGAAVPRQVWERRLRALKEIGVNAIRTSHNPPAPDLLDLCDRLGLLVKDEAFDEFTPTKNKWVEGWNRGAPSRFGYGEVFEEWSVRDVEDLVRRDRNHPSVILWSIGNEIDYPNDPFSHPVLGDEFRPANPQAENLATHARPLIEAVKGLDPTRPVTAALANVPMSEAVGLPGLLDVVGYNYQEQRYASDHAAHPDRVIFGSETRHSYEAWLAVRDTDYIAGQFLWTGIDYLGEARAWPNRASPSGLLDLCGFKKPRGWFRQSLWTDEPMVYLCVLPSGGGRRRQSVEHWNWQEGATVTVQCFANCPEVELTLNGRSLGTESLSEARDGVLTWQVPFESGTLSAVGRRDGKDVCEYALTTAGPAARIELLPDTVELRAGARDICHIEFRVVDPSGTRVPDAEPVVTFTVNGPVTVLGIGNGDVNNTESGRDLSHPAYQGRGLAILQSGDSEGDATVTASAPGLESSTVVLPVLPAKVNHTGP